MIESISDPSDPRIHDYAHVGDHGWLLARGLFVAEGRLVVQRLLTSGRYSARSILLTPAALRAIEASVPASARVFVADQSVVNGVTSFNFHRGCLAMAERPPALALSSLLSSRTVLALEGVGNPDNVGGLFRVGAAFGVGAVLLDPGSGDPFYRKAIRTSMGAVLSVPFVRADAWPGALRELRDAGFTVVALTPSREADSLDELVRRAPSRVVVTVGAEGPGLTDDALAATDLRVRIPISAEVDSLNVTVAAGIALARLYESAGRSAQERHS